MSSRIERGKPEVISISGSRRWYDSRRDGGATLGDWHDERQRQQGRGKNARSNGEDARPGMYRTSGEAARSLAEIVGAWGLFCWFVGMMVRGSEVGGWELAGFAVALLALAWMAAGGRRG